MLTITVPEMEFLENDTGRIIKCKRTTLNLEHSLVSLSKWEARWKKPFLKKGYQMTREEILDYIRCMTITQNVPDSVYVAIEYNQEIVDAITEYINDPMTATTITNHGPKTAFSRIVTSEVIYSWMIQYNVPVEFQKWHLNRLLTLIQVCNSNNAKPQKMSKRDVAIQQAKLNEERRRKFNTTG